MQICTSHTPLLPNFFPNIQIKLKECDSQGLFFPHVGEGPPVLKISQSHALGEESTSRHFPGRESGSFGLRKPTGFAELTVESPLVPSNGFQTNEERLRDSGILIALRCELQYASLLRR